MVDIRIGTPGLLTSEDSNTREKDTRSLLRQQEQMMAKQDQDLSELSKGIGLKNIAAIGEGVSLTSALLDDIGKVSIKPMELAKRDKEGKNLKTSAGNWPLCHNFLADHSPGV